MAPSEPCDRCGDETAVGSPLFAGRHQGRLEDGDAVFRCGECAAQDMVPHEQDRPGDQANPDWLTKSLHGVAVYKQW